jgi:NACalpha-BTF3-like transcription factor
MESSSNDACTLSVDTDAKLVVSNSDNSENHENHENREKFDNSENKIISISEDTPIINDIDKDDDDIPKTRQQLINEYYTNLQKQKYERFIEITMNQTTYTREEAIASLEKHKGDITLVIKEFLGVKDNRDEIEKQKNSKSLNQKRYSIIRECMDNAARNFAKKQQQAKMYSEFIEKQKRLQEEKQEKQDRQDKEI